MHIRQANGSKTRIRLSTDGLAVGSKNSSVFKNAKTPYEFFPLTEISDLIVDNEYRNVLLVIKELADGNLEILAYRLANEPEAKLFQQTFDEIAVKSGGRGQMYAQQQAGGNWAFTTTRPGDTINGHETWRSATHSRPRTHHSTTSLTDGTNKKTDGYVYRMQTGQPVGTPVLKRHHMHHKSDSDDENTRREISELTKEVSQLRTIIRDRTLSTDNDVRVIQNNNNDELDGPIRLIFTKDGVIETHGSSTVVREGSESGSDRDSGIQTTKTHGTGHLVDVRAGTVRAASRDYRNSSSTTTARHRSTGSAFDQTDLDTTRGNRASQHSYDNGYATGAHRTGASTARSGGGIVHHGIIADNYVRGNRGVSPAPSMHSRAQSEGGWRLRMPWRHRSQSADGRYRQQQFQRWETASTVTGGRMAQKVYVPDGQTPPERIVLYPTAERNIRSRHASRYEL